MEDIFLVGVEKKYPKELLESRLMTEGNVIALLYKDILLIDETDLKSENFITQDGRFYFEIVKNIREKNFSVIDEITMLSECSSIVVEGFERRGGWQQLQNMIDVINDKNTDVYFDNLYKENIILRLHEDGFNLLSPINIDGKEIVPIKLFKKMNSEAVIEWYEARLSNLGTGYSTKILEEEELDIDDDFIESCEEGNECGVPFDISDKNISGDDTWCLPTISRQINGLLEGTTTFVGGYSSTGKTNIFVTIIMGLLHRDRKVLIISNEQKIKVFKLSFLIWILCKHFKYFNLTKTKMQSGEVNEKDREYIKKAQKYWREKYKGKVHFIAIQDADIALAKKKMREYILKSGFDTILYDTFKLDIDGSKNDNHWISLIKDSRELDKIAKKYNIIMMCSLQLAINTLGKLFLDASVLSNSKQIKETLENLILMRTAYSEELDKQNKKYYCNPFRRVRAGDKWVEEPYEVDYSSVYRMVFIDKSRMGSNSGDTGIAHLLKFDGSHGLWYEEALCRPRHGVIV